MTPCWLALATDDVDAEALQCLTTRIMAWGEGVWLFDLTPFLSYWQRQARARRQDMFGLWREILHHVFGGRRPGDKVVAMHVRFQAVLARHPAEALLLLHHMKARRLTGFVTTATEFGARLCEQLRWESFWAFAEEVASHGQRLKMRGWSGSSRSEWERGKRAIARLGAKKPRDMRHIKPDAMQRRFGKRLGLIWEWCWFPASGPAQGFPWEDWQPGETVRVTRHLDHAVFSWQELLPWLRLDFDRLASTCGERRIGMMEWDLTLSNMETVTIPIGFRHPHRLREEVGTQTTALLQAEYVFQAFEMSRREAVAEGGEIPPYPVSWDLTVTSMLSLPPVLRDLFQDVLDGQGDEDGLTQLENELPIPLVRFAWREDWVPEDSYQEGVACETPEGPWHGAALRRPLFLYEKPCPLSGATRQASFAETVMTKWWREPSQEDGERHYFRLLSEKNDALWVYRDGKGQWWVHGVFG